MSFKKDFMAHFIMGLFADWLVGEVGGTKALKYAQALVEAVRTIENEKGSP